LLVATLFVWAFLTEVTEDNELFFASADRTEFLFPLPAREGVRGYLLLGIESGHNHESQFLISAASGGGVEPAAAGA
jgi:hypothetical protein